MAKTIVVGHFDSIEIAHRIPLAPPSLMLRYRVLALIGRVPPNNRRTSALSSNSVICPPSSRLGLMQAAACAGPSRDGCTSGAVSVRFWGSGSSASEGTGGRVLLPLRFKRGSESALPQSHLLFRNPYAGRNYDRAAGRSQEIFVAGLFRVTRLNPTTLDHAATSNANRYELAGKTIRQTQSRRRKSL